jgi:hypothetical protein
MIPSIGQRMKPLQLGAAVTRAHMIRVTRKSENAA